MDINPLKPLEPLVKIGEKVYDDAVSPTAKEVGKLIATVPAAINAALLSLNQWIANRDYALKETRLLLEQKLVNVDPEKIISPEPYVAVPALQAISYCMDSDILRNLFANLLAKSMYSDTKELVHPAFVDIISQLSPFDAKVLSRFIKERGIPLANIQKRSINNQGSYFIVSANILWNSDNPVVSTTTKTTASINNLQRLGLIETAFTKTFFDFDYGLFKNLDIYKKCSISQEETLSIEGGIANQTQFGHDFITVCCLDTLSPVEEPSQP